MGRNSFNIAKACDPCRRAKVRCNGGEPCARCSQRAISSQCMYRCRARNRLPSHRHLQASEERKTTRVSAEAAAVSNGVAEAVASSTSRSPGATEVGRGRGGVRDRGGDRDRAKDADAGGVSEGGATEATPASRSDADSVRTPHYYSVTAAHGHDSEFMTNPRLFYGPSSAFAFMQQFHRLIQRPSGSGSGSGARAAAGGGVAGSGGESGGGSGSGAGPPPDPEADPGTEATEEGSAGLDLFKKRTFFFGVPQRVTVLPQSRTPHGGPELSDSVPQEDALVFLSHYRQTLHHLMPSYGPEETDALVASFYGVSSAPQPASPQLSALVLAMLAIGALSTCQTDRAELLFAMAKREAAPFDDAVSLTMIHFSLLLAYYQNLMGRPNASYLHTGVACRKVLAMGLNTETRSRSETAQMVHQRRLTVWAVYYFEAMQALISGRHSLLKKAHIQTPFPDGEPFLAGLCRLAQIAEDGAAGIYSRRCTSLLQLYTVAVEMRSRMRACADDLGLDFATPRDHPQRSIDTPFQSLYLHCTYYHTMLLTFRPFLIAEFALHCEGKLSTSAEPMWLRQACRYATDAAQDALVFMRSMYSQDEECKTIRYNAFFLESSCDVLMFDTVRHPSKFPYNKDLVQLALSCLDEMVYDDPVIEARASIAEILRIVAEFISGVPSSGGAAAQLHCGGTPHDAASSAVQGQTPMSDKFWLPVPQAEYPPSVLGQQQAGMVAPGGDHFLDALPDFDLNVLTTDLFTFFPTYTIWPPEHEHQFEGNDPR